MWLNTYTLSPIHQLNSKTDRKPRRGFFVKDSAFKIKETDFKTFLQFSEYIHWPELGDPDFKDLRPLLTSLTSQDIHFPFAITEGDLTPVKSNALISAFDKYLGEQLDQRQEEKFEVLKFKMGREFRKEYDFLMKMNLSSFLVRVDFNNIFSPKEADEALSMLKKIPNLEYAEDPTPYVDYHWSQLEKIVPLGLDDFSTDTKKLPKHFQFRIVKPLRGLDIPQLVQWTYEKKKVVVTNMMDNIIGTWKAYLYHCELKKHVPYHLCTPGFYTHHLYESFPLQKHLGFKGAEWSYDKTKLANLISDLNRLSWSELNILDPKTLDAVIQEQES